MSLSTSFDQNGSSRRPPGWAIAALPALLSLTLSLECAPPGTWSVSTVAGSGRAGDAGGAGQALAFDLSEPFGIEAAPDGALYICEVGHHRLVRLDAAGGRVTVIAGTGTAGSGGDGGPAAQASLNEPYEVRLDAARNLYVVDMVGSVVRRIDATTGKVTTVAGSGKAGFAGDGGPAVKAELLQPHSLALDDRGGLYIADIGNHRIRRVDLRTGLIETIAGNGERELPKEGKAAGRPMLGPRALCVAAGALWIALREGHSVWRLDLESGMLSHVAGSGKAGYRDGAAAEAAFNGPKGIAAGPGGDLFVVDTENQAIRRIDLKSRTVATVAGVGPDARGFGGDGGPALEARFDRPHGIAVDARGVLYIGDTNNHRVRRLVFAP